MVAHTYHDTSATGPTNGYSSGFNPQCSCLAEYCPGVLRSTINTILSVMTFTNTITPHKHKEKNAEALINKHTDTELHNTHKQFYPHKMVGNTTAVSSITEKLTTSIKTKAQQRNTAEKMEQKEN